MASQDITSNQGSLPLDQQDIIPIKRPAYNKPIHENAVNFAYIVKTGEIPIVANNRIDTTFLEKAGTLLTHHDYAKYSNRHIDWKSDDEFTRALKTIENNSAERIQRDPVLQQMLKQDSWAKPERETWESKVSGIVAEETAKIPGFAHYRTDGGKDPMHSAKDIKSLNELSSDIKHHTEKLVFDCGVETVIKGVVIQKLEHDHGFLPKTAGPGDYKKAANYFYAAGGVTMINHHDNQGGHASIFTPAGNTIEATLTDGASYQKSLYENSTLEQFIRGKEFHAVDGIIYNLHPDAKGQDVSQIQATDKLIAKDRSNREDLNMFSAAKLRERAGWPGHAVTETPEGGFLVDASKTKKNGKDVFEVKIFQKQMVGTAQEGYVMVGYGASDNGKAPIVKEYEDVLANKTYKFQTTFKDNGVAIDLAHKTPSGDAFISGVETSYAKAAASEPAVPARHLHSRIMGSTPKTDHATTKPAATAIPAHAPAHPVRPKVRPEQPAGL